MNQNIGCKQKKNVLICYNDTIRRSITFFINAYIFTVLDIARNLCDQKYDDGEGGIRVSGIYIIPDLREPAIKLPFYRHA